MYVLRKKIKKCQKLSEFGGISPPFFRSNENGTIY
jgi:hypothetical protein